jgi:hypothetical protein
MGHLLVDITMLEHVAGGLKDAAGQLDGLGRTLRAASADDLGSNGLNSAADGFFKHWGYGTGKLGEAAHLVGEQVDQALEVYEQADQSMDHVLRGP